MAIYDESDYYAAGSNLDEAILGFIVLYGILWLLSVVSEKISGWNYTRKQKNEQIKQ